MTPTLTTIGFDVSIARTGWAAITYDHGTWITGGLIRTDPRLNLIPRLVEIRRQTWDVLEQFDGGVDVGIEEGVAHRNGDTTRKLAMAWGVVALSCNDRLGIEPHEVNISTVKTCATGRGNADKGAMVAAAVDRWGDEADDEDIADAAWIAEATRLWMHTQYPKEGE